jgi:hypothetical protein
MGAKPLTGGCGVTAYRGVRCNSLQGSAVQLEQGGTVQLEQGSAVQCEQGALCNSSPGFRCNGYPRAGTRLSCFSKRPGNGTTGHGRKRRYGSLKRWSQTAARFENGVLLRKTPRLYTPLSLPRRGKPTPVPCTPPPLRLHGRWSQTAARFENGVLLRKTPRLDTRLVSAAISCYAALKCLRGRRGR